MENLAENRKVLIPGATGFVGKRLVEDLCGKKVFLRLLARTLSKIPDSLRENPHVEIVRGDLLTREGLAEALQGIETAFYLVDSVGGRSIFRNMEYAEKDKRAPATLWPRPRPRA